MGELAWENVGGKTEEVPVTGLEVFLIYGAYRLVRGAIESQSQSSRVPATPPAPPTKQPQDVVAFVGRTGAGKSSTANALVGTPAFQTGVEHGTTVSIGEVWHGDGYAVRDTPGLLDDVDYSGLIWPAIEDARLVVFVAKGQLYRPELETIGLIHQKQRVWDILTGTPGKRRLAVFVNFADVKRQTMPTAVREREAGAIHEQVMAHAPTAQVIFGAASPTEAGRSAPAEIEELRTLIRSNLSA